MSGAERHFQRAHQQAKLGELEARVKTLEAIVGGILKELTDLNRVIRKAAGTERRSESGLILPEEP